MGAQRIGLTIQGSGAVAVLVGAALTFQHIGVFLCLALGAGAWFVGGWMRSGKLAV